MVTGAQIRMARALLRWSQQELARKAKVSLNAVNRLERGKADSRSSTVIKIEWALRKGGVEFLEGDGVRRRQRPSAARQKAVRRVSGIGRGQGRGRRRGRTGGHGRA